MAVLDDNSTTVDACKAILEPIMPMLYTMPQDERNKVLRAFYDAFRLGTIEGIAIGGLAAMSAVESHIKESN